MKEAESPFEFLKPYLVSESAEQEIKDNIKKKDLVKLLLELKTRYEEQQTLIKVIEHQLHALIKTINGPQEEKPEEEKKKKETFINEKILRKSLEVLERDKKLEREILAVGEHYKVDIYKLIWKKPYIREYYVRLSKKMKKKGFHDYKLNWSRINKLIKHQGKSIDESEVKDIPPRKITKIKALVNETLS